MNVVRPSLTMLRWLALGAAAGAALVLALDVFGLTGPFQAVALGLVLLALFAIGTVVFTRQHREKDRAQTEDAARAGAGAGGRKG